MAIVYDRIPGKIMPKPLIVRCINGKDYYWNYASQKWTRLTKRCPLL